jgi:hypothetical protein
MSEKGRHEAVNAGALASAAGPGLEVRQLMLPAPSSLLVHSQPLCLGLEQLAHSQYLASLPVMLTLPAWQPSD